MDVASLGTKKVQHRAMMKEKYPEFYFEIFHPFQECVELDMSVLELFLKVCHSHMPATDFVYEVALIA